MSLDEFQTTIFLKYSNKAAVLSNAVDYAKKKYVLPTILSIELRGQYNKFLH